MPRYKLKRRKVAKRAEKLVQPTSRVDWAELWAELFERLAGGESVKEICSDYPTWPAPRVLHRLIAGDSELTAAYNLAWKCAVMAISEEILTIADDGRNDYMAREDARGRVELKFDSEVVQRSRLRIDARLKLLEAHDPERFGKKIDLSNKDGSFTAAWSQALGIVSEERHATKH